MRFPCMRRWSWASSWRRGDDVSTMTEGLRVHLAPGVSKCPCIMTPVDPPRSKLVAEGALCEKRISYVGGKIAGQRHHFQPP